MIVGVSIEGGVRDHERLIAEFAKRPMVREIDADDDRRSIQRDERKIDSPAKTRGYPFRKCPGAQVADHGDEVPLRRIS